MCLFEPFWGFCCLHSFEIKYKAVVKPEGFTWAELKDLCPLGNTKPLTRQHTNKLLASSMPCELYCTKAALDVYHQNNTNTAPLQKLVLHEGYYFLFFVCR